MFVSELYDHRIAVFRRSDGALLRRFGRKGSGDGELYHPMALCVMGTTRRIAVVDFGNHRISVFTTEGAFDRHVGTGGFRFLHGIACSQNGNELFVADWRSATISVLRDNGEVLHRCGDDEREFRDFFTSIAIHGGRIFAQSYHCQECVVFT